MVFKVLTCIRASVCTHIDSAFVTLVTAYKACVTLRDKTAVSYFTSKLIY